MADVHVFHDHVKGFIGDRKNKVDGRGAYGDDYHHRQDHEREIFDHEFNAKYMLPDKVKAIDLDMVKTRAEFSVGSAGACSYSANSNVQIRFGGHDYISGLHFEFAQAIITGLTTGYRLKSVYDMFEEVLVKLNGNTIAQFGDRAITAWMRTHNDYNEVSGETSTENHYGTAVGSASTWVFDFSDVLRLWGRGKKFPCGFWKGGYLEFQFKLKSLQNCTTSASGTAAGGAITGFKAIVEYEDYSGKYQNKMDKFREAHPNVAIPIPYMYMWNTTKYDLASASETAIDITGTSKLTKEVLVLTTTDAGADSIVNGSEIMTEFYIKAGGRNVYPSYGLKELQMANTMKMTKAGVYTDGMYHVLRADFSNDMSKYDPARITGVLDMSKSDTQLLLTQSAATATDVYIFAVCYGLIQVYPDRVVIDQP